MLCFKFQKMKSISLRLAMLTVFGQMRMKIFPTQTQLMVRICDYVLQYSLTNKPMIRLPNAGLFWGLDLFYETLKFILTYDIKERLEKLWGGYSFQVIFSWRRSWLSVYKLQYTNTIKNSQMWCWTCVRYLWLAYILFVTTYILS